MIMVPEPRSSIIFYLLSSAFCVNFIYCIPNAPASLERNFPLPEPKLETIAKWKVVDYKFKSRRDRETQIANGKFIPENNYVGGIKVYEDRIFLTAPRLKPGVPVTLAYIQNKVHFLKSPKLIPFPNWEMQKLGNCSAFQNVISMEIDRYSRMWIIDSGRINVLAMQSVNRCPPSISILDLKTNQVIRKHVIAPAVSSPTTGVLDDIVVACSSKDHCFAYISNPMDNKVTIYNLIDDRSWSVQHPSMVPDPLATNIRISGINYNISFGTNGIALSNANAGYDRLYYSPLSSYALYSVSTKTLKNSVSNGTTTLADSAIRTEGTRVSQSDGMVVDNIGRLFYGQLNRNALAYTQFQRMSSGNLKETTYAQSNKKLEWIDALGFDNSGHLYFTTNKFGRYVQGTQDFSTYNFRVLRIKTQTKSYMYY